VPAETGRPAYHPAVMLKLYLYGYLNRIPSSHRLEREAQRNVELVWLTGRLAGRPPAGTPVLVITAADLIWLARAVWAAE
jgi:hypothetical protein